MPSFTAEHRANLSAAQAEHWAGVADDELRRGRTEAATRARRERREQLLAEVERLRAENEELRALVAA